MSPIDWFKNLPKTKIFSKYLRSTLVVSVLPILILAVISLIFMAVINYNNTILSLKEILNGRVQRVNLYVEYKIRDAMTAANDPKMADFYISMAQAFKSGIKSELYKKTYESFFPDIRNIVDDNRFYDGMLIDLNGNIIATRKQEPDLGVNILSGQMKASQLAAAFVETLKTGNAVISNFEHYEPSGMHSMFVLVPVKKSGKSISVLALQFENEDINSLTNDTGGPDKTTEILAGIKDGNNIIFINKLKRDKRAAFVRTVTIGGKIGVPIQKAVEGKTGSGLENDYYGKNVASAWTYIPALKWGIVSKKDMREVMQPVLNLGFIYLIIGLFMIFISVLSAVRISEGITMPVIAIARAVKKVASGTLSERAVVETKDEIEDLAADFNAMASKLEGNIERLKQANAAINEERKKVLSYLDVSESLIVELDTKGNVITANKKFKDVLGYTPQELKGKNWFDLFVPAEMKERVQVPFEKMMAGENGNIEYFENVLPTKNGDMKTIYWHNTLNLDDNGKITSTLSSGVDVTRIKSVEKSLKESEEKYRHIFENTQAAIFRSKLDGSGLIDFNESFVNLFEYTPEELMGLKSEAMWSDMGQRKYLIDTLKKEGFVRNYVIEILANREKIKTVIASLTLNAGLGLIEGVFSDISELKAAREELEKSEKRYRATFEQASVGVVHATANGILLNANSEFCRITGYGPEELRGRSFAEITHPDDAEHDMKMITAIAAGVIPNYTVEKRYIRKDGSTIWAGVNVAPVEEKGRIAYFVIVVEDISTRKKTEEALKSAMEELKRSNSDLEQFAYISSHDLQEPLRSIAGYLQLLDRKYRGQLDNDADSYINSTIAATERMKNIINDVLQYSKISRKADPFTVVDANEAVDQAVMNLQVAVTSNKARVVFTNLPQVFGDFGQLSRLFQNFISNSIKFRKTEDPLIEITARENSKDFIFMVKDNGIGIDPQYNEKVFAIFQRLHSRREYPGTGIGLAVCKKIVERHGGRIWLESQPGSGTTFYFTIPKRRE